MLARIALLLVLSSPAFAAPIFATDPTGFVLEEIQGIQVNGATYNARFVDGSFEDIFTETTGYDRLGRPITDFFYDFGRGSALGAPDAAIAAARALMSAIDQAPQWDFHQSGYSIAGTGSPQVWRLMFPYYFSGASIENPGSVYAVGIAEGITNDDIFTGTVYPYDPNAAATNTDFQFSSMDVWVDWTQAANGIPAPPTIWLLATAIGLLTWHRFHTRGRAD